MATHGTDMKTSPNKNLGLYSVHPQADNAVEATYLLDQPYACLSPNDHAPTHIHARRAESADEMEAVD